MTQDYGNKFITIFIRPIMAPIIAEAFCLFRVPRSALLETRINISGPYQSFQNASRRWSPLKCRYSGAVGRGKWISISMISIFHGGAKGH